MKNKIVIRFVFLLCILSIKISYAQRVGVGNNDPKAVLDITASNQVTPSNTDGVLIPRINKFPVTNPTSAQKSMMVYLTTTVGSNVPGFYYWDGTAWVCITCASASGSGGHYIGEKFGGGIIFYLDTDRQHGLIASLKDLGPNTGTKWKYKNINTHAKSSWDGAANTAAIMSITPVENNSAAKRCDDYTHDGYSDWYLPSIWELTKLYNNARIINEVLETDGDSNTQPLYYHNPNVIANGDVYWSSTENWDNGASKYALGLSFETGKMHIEDKNNNSYGKLNVRAIRKF